MNETTTPADLLTQLQAAWRMPAVGPAPEPPARIREVLAELSLPNCEPHLPPFDMVDEPDPKRSGFVLSKCRRCGRFLGYRLASGSIQSKRRS